MSLTDSQRTLLVIAILEADSNVETVDIVYDTADLCSIGFVTYDCPVYRSTWTIRKGISENTIKLLSILKLEAKFCDLPGQLNTGLVHIYAS